MIDTKVIEMLDSPQPAERAKAVKALARSGDREALTYLADVYRYDDNDDVRELARKAGLYIRKNVPETPVAEDRLGGDDLYGGSLYDDDEEDDYDDAPPEPDIPLPSEIYVTDSQRNRAQGYMDQAMDFNIRGANTKATEALQKAINLNPQLISDKFALSMASTITGLPGQEAMKRLGPSADELRKRAAKSRRGASADVRNPVQSALAGLVMVCAIVALVGYFAFPWVDLGSLEDPQSGLTLNQGIDLLEANVRVSASEQEAATAQAVLDAIELSPNGFATTQYSSGMTTVLDYFGIIDAIVALFNQFAAGLDVPSSEINQATDEFIAGIEDEFGEFLSIDPEPLDFTLWLVPLVAIFGGTFSIILLQGTTISKWSIAIVIGLIGVVPMLYFYANGIDSLFERTIALGETAVVEGGGVNALGGLGGLGLDDLGLSDAEIAQSGEQAQQLADQFDGNDLLGLGFWMSLVSILGITLLPFIGMLFIPQEPESS